MRSRDNGALDGALEAFYGDQLGHLLHQNTIAEMVPISQMFREAEYARPVNEREVRRIAGEWDPLLCLDVVLSMRNDGRFALIDGSHRHAGATLRGGPPVLPSRVFIDLSIEQEAELFSKLNKNRIKASPMDVFRASWRHGDLEALTIRSTCRTAGFDVAIDGKGPNRIEAVGALRSMYARFGPGGLLDVLSIIGEAWGTDGAIKGTTHSWVLLGLMNFWARYVKNPRYDRKWLVKKLRASEPEIVLGRSQKHRTVKSGLTPPLAVGKTLLEMYNPGRPPGLKLPEWQDHFVGAAAAARARAAKQAAAAQRAQHKKQQQQQP